MRMGQETSKKPTNGDLLVSSADKADQRSEMQGSSVDRSSRSTEHFKVKDNSNVFHPDKPITSAVVTDTDEKCDSTEQRQHGVRGEEFHNGIEQGSQFVKKDTLVAQRSGAVAMDTAEQQRTEVVVKDTGAMPQLGTDGNTPALLHTSSKEQSYEEEEPLIKSLYNGQCVFPSQDGKESWQDDDGNISNVFPSEETAPVQGTFVVKPVKEEPLFENKMMSEECPVKPVTTITLGVQDDKGDNPVNEDDNNNPSTTENDCGQPSTNLNGLSPKLQEAYTEFQDLFSYVNDLKLSNRRIMKRLTDEQQKYKKTTEDSEAKVSDLEECVTILEDRVTQREGQIRNFKGIIQVLLQKVSLLSSALADIPGNNGQGYEGLSSEEEDGEEEKEDLEKKYMLPKPLTDKPETAVTALKHRQTGYQGDKAVTGTDNRVDYDEPRSSKVLRRALKERSKTRITGNSGKSSETYSNTGMVHQKEQKLQNVQKEDKPAQQEATKSEDTVTTPKTKEPRGRKKSPRQVPALNEFRNTLTEVTNLTKESRNTPTPFNMDINSWIHEANMEIIKGSESTSPIGQGPNVVLCLDISQSMEGTPFFNMIQGVLKYIDGVENIRLSLGFQINLAIVTFGHKTAVIHHLTNEFSVIRDTVRNLTTGGTSPLTAGLLLSTAASIGQGKHGITIGGYAQHPRVIVFTDGRATLESRLIGEDVPLDGDFSYEVLCNMLGVLEDARRRKLTISYVPMGDFFPRYMEQVAEMTGGKRYPLDQLDKAIRHNKNFAFAVKLMEYIKEATGGNLKDENLNRLVLTSVASNDPYVTKDDEEEILEIVSKVDDLEKVSDSDSDGDEGHHELEDDMPPLGSRVRRGPDWSWNNQDSNMAGTVVSHKTNGWLYVMWDNGYRNKYCYGRGGKYDIIPVDEPRTLAGKSIQVGCMVKRGPDWDKGNVDGGEGRMGSVIHVYPNNRLLVRWPSKAILDHNYGCDNKFEVTMCDPSEQLAHMMEASYGGATAGASLGATGGASWGTTGGATLKTTGSDEKSRSVEKEKEDKTADTKTDDYIAKLNRLNQRNISSLEMPPASESALSQVTESIPSRTQDRSSEIQAPVKRLSSGRHHIGRSPAESLPSDLSHSEKSSESSQIEHSNLTDRHLTDHGILPTEGGIVTAGVSPRTDNITGVTDNVTGVTDNITGGKDNVSGGKDNVSGGKDNVSGDKDNVSGVTDNITGGKDNVTGVTDNITGGKDNVTGVKVGCNPSVVKLNPNDDRDSEEKPDQLGRQPHPVVKLDSIQSGGYSGVRNTSMGTTPQPDTTNETAGKVTWQYRDEYGGWICYSEENSNKIEKTFTKSKKGMTVINGGKHRILLAKMMQVHTTTKHMTSVRRQVN